MADLIKQTIGCDLGDKFSTLCILTGTGKEEQVERPQAVPTTQDAMRKFFTRERAHVVLETGTHSRWVSKLLMELGHQVTVANPRQVALISRNQQKSDQRDPELLARLGRADTKLLSPIRHRSDEAHQDLEFIKARDVLVRTRTKLVNHVRGAVKSFGYRLPSCDAAAFHRRTQQEVPLQLRPMLKPMFAVLEVLEKKIKAYDKLLEKVAKKYPDVEIISQPNGVGLLTALTFLLTLEDKERFAKSRMVPAVIGLTPRRDQSGAVDKQLSITKAGPPLLRRLLVQSANYVLGPFGKESDLRIWGLKLTERGGKNAKKRAKVAVARKLAVLMHRLWVTGEEYQPIGYGKKRVTQPEAA
jgi:transposase